MGRRSRRLYAIASGAPVSPLADFALPLVLPAAMFHGADLGVRGPISRDLAAKLPETMRYLARWDRRLRPIEVSATSEEAIEAGEARATASFFSGGLDSFYTLLAHGAEISTLIFVHGFDIALTDRSLRERAVSAVREAAAELDKDVVEVEANWRTLLDEYVDWEPQGHRLFMAAAGLLLAPRFRCYYLPAGLVSDDLVPSRTDPGFYPAWDRPGLELTADGVGMKRIDKARAVVACDTALRHLRVCWENRGGAYNCGRCEKCLRTMAALRALGALDRCPTFERPLDLDALGRVYVYNESLYAYWQEILDFLHREGSDPELEAALVRCLAPKPALERRLSGLAWSGRKLLLSAGRRELVANAVRKRTHIW